MKDANVVQHFRTIQLGTPQERGEGVRIGAVRYLPRGVRKSEYAERDFFDVWLPLLAPSGELLRAYKDGLPFCRFAARYRREMGATEPRQMISLLAKLSKRAPLSVGCYCDDESCCHRKILGELIRRAAS